MLSGQSVKSLVEQFEDAMLDIHRSAGELKPPYRAHGFLSLVRQYGGKDTADRLLATTNPSEGFTELFLRGPENLRLSVEYLVLCNPWRTLFDEDQLAVARRRLQDVHCPLPREKSAHPVTIPEEVAKPSQFPEGATTSIVVNAHERNAAARAVCISHHGPICAICGFNFAATYGAIADGFIHVHHLRPLSQCGGEYHVDPIADLLPVCANCHAVIHLGGACRSIVEMRSILIKSR